MNEHLTIPANITKMPRQINGNAFAHGRSRNRSPPKVPEIQYGIGMDIKIKNEYAYFLYDKKGRGGDSYLS